MIVSKRALVESEERYRLLFESSPLSMWVYDVATLAFLAVNEAAIRQYGYTREEFLAMTIKNIRPPEDLPALVKSVENTSGNFDSSDIWRHRKKDGTVIDVEISSHLIRFYGHRARLVLANDITQRRRAERELKTANQGLAQALTELRAKRDEVAGMTQQLWQASKLAIMGELSASVAHELNNPLATIALRTELLIEQSSESKTVRNSAEIILSEVERMASLVDNLLQFSRRSHRQVSTVNVAEEISNSLNFISYYLRNRNIIVVPEFAANVSTIQADRQQLRQLFLNLLTNAADAMPRGGKLTVRAAPTVLDGVEAIAVEFADTGEGISAENLEKVWEPFFTTKPEGKGTGLGLAICRRIVEEHGGIISIESNNGNGANVRMVFPATATEGAVKLS